MPEELSKRERLLRTVHGQPVDRLPLSVWRHFYPEETSAQSLAERLLRWHRQFDFDFMKINVRAQYHTEGWGSAFEYFDEEHTKPVRKALGVQKAEDFKALQPLDLDKWPLSEMLELIRLLRRELGPDEVMLMTIFNPMSIAHDLVGGAENLRAMIETDPKAVHQGLRTITSTFQDFVPQCIDRGADGIFLATTHVASARNFTRNQYEEFGRPYDLEVLEETRGAFFNMLHVCDKDSYVKLLSDYPLVQALHWDTNDSRNVTLQDMAGRLGDTALAGGLSSELFAEEGGCVQLLEELELARQMMGDTPFIVAPTCTIPTQAREENIVAVCHAVRNN